MNWIPALSSEALYGTAAVRQTLRYAHLFPSKQTEMIERLEKERTVKANVN